jgi:thiamine-monophosphate kinase
MSGSEDHAADPVADLPDGPVDEFDWIERCLRPLAKGAPEAMGLWDDAAVIPARPGFDLVVSKDALVEGVHFLASDPLDLVARKVLRVNLSDLAAKGAEPYGYFLAIAWPASHGWAERRAFARGLREDQSLFGLKLFGGDTVSTPGPLTISATILGWVPAGGITPRAGARIGDVVLVTGTIGDGALGLSAARGEGMGLAAADAAWLEARYRTPDPRLGLGDGLRRWAHAASDVSDGLIADAGRIAEASGVRIVLDIDQAPLSAAAAVWLSRQGDAQAGRLALAAGGDDYEVLCTAPAPAVSPLKAVAHALGYDLTAVGLVSAGSGVEVLSGGRAVAAVKQGWRHGSWPQGKD